MIALHAILEKLPGRKEKIPEALLLSGLILSLHKELLEVVPLLQLGYRKFFDIRNHRIEVPSFIIIITTGFVNTHPIATDIPGVWPRERRYFQGHAKRQRC
jgi:hypothetical protein